MTNEIQSFSENSASTGDISMAARELLAWIVGHCHGTILGVGAIPPPFMSCLEKRIVTLENLQKDNLSEDRLAVAEPFSPFLNLPIHRKYDSIILWNLQLAGNAEKIVEKAFGCLNPNGVVCATAIFGINDSELSPNVFYLTGLQTLLSQYGQLADWEMAAGHICVSCSTSEKPTPKNTYTLEEVRKLEKAFYDRHKEILETLLISKNIARKALLNKDARWKELGAKMDGMTAAITNFGETSAKWQQEKEDLLNQHFETLNALEKMTHNFNGMQARNKKLEADGKSLRLQAKRAMESINYRIGSAFMEASSSVGGFLKLPITLIRLALENRRIKSGTFASPKMIQENLPLPAPAFDKKQLRKPFGSRLRIAAIMDPFTYQSYLPECALLNLSPDEWQDEVDNFKPDLLFIESAWEGKNGEWKLKVSQFAQILKDLIAYCRSKGIPVIFWNKEDPPHFNTFLPVARSADFIFTTDMDCIPRYKKAAGHDRVYLLPFAAQTAFHNPSEKYERKHAFCFAGSYYIRYPERRRDFDMLISVLEEQGQVDIYDRNYGREHPHYMFPEKYKGMILGSLPYEEMDKAYKGYDFGINMNTGKQSQSMFARRVFEMAASNTIVISNFSRGMRNFFGDLIISGDDGREIKRRLLPLMDDPSLYRKMRLLALRHVLDRHTYKHRLEYIREKIWDISPAGKPKVAVIATPKSPEEAAICVENFRKQDYPAKTLWLIGDNAAVEPAEDIHWASNAGDCRMELEKDKPALIGFMDPAHFYGPAYLTDLALGLSWCGEPIYGKAARFIFGGEGVQLLGNGSQYRISDDLPIWASLVQASRWEDFWQAIQSGASVLGAGMAFDEFNFIENGANLSADEQTLCLDPDVLDKGIDFNERLLPLSERLVLGKEPLIHDDDARVYRGASLAILYKSSTYKLKLQLLDDGLQITSQLSDDKHTYLHTERRSREYLNLVLNSETQLDMEGDLNVRFAFIFFDEDNNRISHQIVQNGGAALIIPDNCVNVEIALRVEGSGYAKIRSLRMGNMVNPPAALACHSNCLVVGKNYPAYDDLYKYAFVHSRVLGYKECGKLVDVYRACQCNASFREFESVDVATGDFRLLEDTLKSGQITNVFVHLIDRQIWNALKEHLDKIRLTIWIHGAEIQSWQRRDFEFANMTEEEIEIKKRRCNGYLDLWREILALGHPNVEYVFVSDTLKHDSEEDVGMPFPAESTHVIHNFINGQRFPYLEKTPDMRFHILSVRPFSALTYANDLTVEAIKNLSERPGFDRYSFTICGDGPLFERTTRPLRDMPNVKLEQKILTHAEMVEKFAENGIFLLPTRSDTQGVSRDEAMASGLVPVTNAVGAVPEFTDTTCAMLEPPEDPAALADAIEKLAGNPEKFKKMSKNAAAMPRRISNLQETIVRELDLIKPPVHIEERNDTNELKEPVESKAGQQQRTRTVGIA